MSNNDLIIIKFATSTEYLQRVPNLIIIIENETVNYTQNYVLN